jgi:hypothetical protein
MKPNQRTLLVAVSCFALVCPVRIQIDIAKSGGLALEAAPATAKEGNNGGGKGNSGGNGNGNSGGKGNAGNNGNSGNNGNVGGNGAPGNSGAAGGAGNNGNGNAGGVGNGNGRSGENTNAGRSNSDSRGRSSSQGNVSNPGKSSSQGASSSQSNSNGQGKSSDRGKASGLKAGNALGINQPASTIAGGLSALFGAISDGLRPLTRTPARAADKTRDRKGTAKTKSDSNITGSKQVSRASQKSKDQAGIGKATAGRVSTKAVAANRVRPVRSGMPAAMADRSLPKPSRAKHSIVAVGLTPTDLARLSAQGFRTEMQTKGTLVRVVRLIPPRGMSLGEAQRRVRVADANAAADFDHYYYTDEGSACTGPSCEAISLVGWNRPASEQCGPLPTIGLIDTRINRDHEALKGQSIEILSGLDLRGSPSQRDHGTAVAAILVGRSGSSTPGLLPGARLLAVDAFYRDGGTADRTDVITLVRALEALAERDVRVVNMSLSGSPNEVLKRAIASAQAKGMIIVAAAGNNGAGAEPSYPAAYPGVIAVTAVDKKLAVYSRATQGEYIDLAAPGVDLWVASAGGGGSVKSGTSYAVPFISAAAAILSVSSNTFNATDLQATLESSTLDLGPPGRDRTYGYGLLQAANLCSRPQGETPIARSETERNTELP